MKLLFILGFIPVTLALLLVSHAEAQDCPSPGFIWSGYCWLTRDTGGHRQGPGANIFAPSLVSITSSGSLQLGVAKYKKKWSCSEVFMSKSMGLGDYVFVLESDPSLVDKNLVYSPFIYKNDTAEIDIEFATWGGTASGNAQNVLQPWDATGALKRFTVPSSTFTTHRIRWGGSRTPGQVEFEGWAPGAAGTRFLYWKAQGGKNFVPGDVTSPVFIEGERVHINHWISNKKRPSNKMSNSMVMACFRHCPINATNQGCSEIGVKPTCTNAGRMW